MKATRSVSSRVKDIVICNDSALPLLYRLFRNGICIEFGTDLERIWSEWETKVIRWKETQHLRLDLPYKQRKIKFLYDTCLFFRKFMYLCTYIKWKIKNEKLKIQISVSVCWFSARKRYIVFFIVHFSLFIYSVN